MKIIIAGDFCPRSRTEYLINQRRYSEVLDDVKPIIETADYSIVNLESPVVYSDHAKPIVKCGPNLRCTRNAVAALKYAGFNAVTLANNHILDYGTVGLNDTINTCTDEGLDIMGVGDNDVKAAKILYKKIDNKVVAFINCCENEFSVASDITSGANPINPIRQYYSIKEARKQADYVIMIIHGGHEHYQLPTPRMKATYRYFIDCGADVVINHHQHCYSGYELYNGKPIFYGLGNFCFDNNSRTSGIWTEGYMVNLNIEESISFELIPYIQCADSPNVSLMNGGDLDNFHSTILKLNNTIKNDIDLVNKYDCWHSQYSKNYEMALYPFTNKYMLALAYRGAFPHFWSKTKLANILNFVICESHRELFLKTLKMLVYNGNEKKEK